MLDEDDARWMRWMGIMPLGSWGYRSFGELMRRMDDEFVEFDEFIKNRSEEIMRRWSNSSGALERETGPIVHGYDITFGPDGRSVVREFGNLRRARPSQNSVTTPREPLVDVVDAEREFRVTLELPGVKKEDIDITVDDGILTVSSDRGERKYHERLELPDSAKVDGARSSFNNGILEVVFPKESSGETAVRLKIE